MKVNLTDRQIIRMQSEIIDHQAKTIKRMRDKIRGYIDLGRKNNWKDNRTMLELQDDCERELTFLDSRGAKLEQIRRKIPSCQKRLVG